MNKNKYPIDSFNSIVIEDAPITPDARLHHFGFEMNDILHAQHHNLAQQYLKLNQSIQEGGYNYHTELELYAKLGEFAIALKALSDSRKAFSNME